MFKKVTSVILIMFLCILPITACQEKLDPHEEMAQVYEEFHVIRIRIEKRLQNEANNVKEMLALTLEEDMKKDIAALKPLADRYTYLLENSGFTIAEKNKYSETSWMLHGMYEGKVELQEAFYTYDGMSSYDKQKIDGSFYALKYTEIQ